MKPPKKYGKTGQLSKQLPHPGDGFICTQALGAIYTPQATTFRVFAPTANQIILNLYQKPIGGQAEHFSLAKHPTDGSWEISVKKDCLSYYYTLTAKGDDPGFNSERELIDPYARAVTSHNGRAIVALETFSIYPRPKFSPSDAIIYELHIRDFTIDPDSSIQKRGKYLAFTETNTHLFNHSEILTGLEHLSELGINTVQLMPIGEFQTDESSDQYGWGYDTVHINSPDGWYATERFDSRRIKEVKQMVDALHRRGIKVILDVVFNHTFEALNKRIYSFDGLVPGYYYRRKPDGTYWNGSGVGNEFRSESPMGRRFIIDSVKYWVNEYNIDGFRFDLLGLIDLETVIKLTEELRSIDPNLLIYGEPWAGGETPIEITYKGKQREQGFAVFNDHFRDALKGSVFNARERGFIQSGHNIERVKHGIKGAIEDFTSYPSEVVNYVECHDNHTFADRLLLSTLDDGLVSDLERKAMNKLGAAIILTSQGIPFLQSGQEFARSKRGLDNTYNKPDSINMLRWKDKLINKDLFDYYQGLIALRKAHPMFRLHSAIQIKNSIKFLDSDFGLVLEENTIGYLLVDVTGKDTWSEALVLFNASSKAEDFPIPNKHWEIFVDNKQASLLPIEKSLVKISRNMATVPARSAAIIAVRNSS
ncbi:MAG: type I pullulanase [Acidobacteria bacterium]|nr:type I pullulanase [Acidobacteriota bacterium]